MTALLERRMVDPYNLELIYDETAAFSIEYHYLVVLCELCIALVLLNLGDLRVWTEEYISFVAFGSYFRLFGVP